MSDFIDVRCANCHRYLGALKPGTTAMLKCAKCGLYQSYTIQGLHNRFNTLYPQRDAKAL